MPRSTGPGALKSAFLAFMDDAGVNFCEGSGNYNDVPHNYSEVTAGTYTGWDNRTVRVAGKRKFPNLYIERDSVKKKLHWYAAMNMTSYGEAQLPKSIEKDTTCFRRIYERVGWANRHKPFWI